MSDGSTRPDIQVHKYIPNACPGARAPHVNVVVDGVQQSILGVYEGRWTLVTLPGGTAWREAAQDDLGADVQLVTVGEGQRYETHESAFSALYEIGSTGALLVRPDGHVAFRSADAPDDAGGALRDALAVGLGRQGTAP